MSEDQQATLSSPQNDYAIFQGQLQAFLQTALWGRLENELRRLGPARPLATDQPHVVSQKAMLSQGFDLCIQMIRMIPQLPGSAVPTGDPMEDKLWEHITDPRH